MRCRGDYRGRPFFYFVMRTLGLLGNRGAYPPYAGLSLPPSLCGLHTFARPLGEVAERYISLKRATGSESNPRTVETETKERG